MPVMDGYAATRAIRALPGGAAVKIVALTASVFREDREAILAAGCDDMVSKPVEESRLFETMGRLLNLPCRYQEDAVPPAVADSTSAATLAGLPASLRDELVAAARILDAEAVAAIIGRLRTGYPEAARLLEALVAGYRYDKVVEALAAAGAGQGT